MIEEIFPWKAVRHYLFLFNLEWFIPNLKGYDATFLLQVMKGEKNAYQLDFKLDLV